jgi:SAM-dependent methyltransferase
MNEHLDGIFGEESTGEEKVERGGKGKRSKAKKSSDGSVRPPGASRAWTRDQCVYLLQDVSDLPYEDGHFDVVLDKGMLDAVLSHGEVETGDNDLVQRVNQEVYRVLKPNGVYLIISGMDSFLTTPYFAGDEAVNWDFSHHSFQSRSPSNKTLRTLFFYVLFKRPLEEETES